jgi:hypothetical protein
MPNAQTKTVIRMTTIAIASRDEIKRMTITTDDTNDYRLTERAQFADETGHWQLAQAFPGTQANELQFVIMIRDV